MLFFVTHPPDPRPALVVQTTSSIDANAIDELKQRMFGLRCPSGLIFDETTCVVLHDTYTSLGIESLREDGRVSTDKLLTRVHATGRTIDQRVFDWLQSMSSSWDAALPEASDVAAPFITDIVPAVSGSFVREVA